MGRAWACASSRLPKQFFCAPEFEKHFSRKKRKKVGIGILEGRGKKNRDKAGEEREERRVLSELEY